MIYHKKLQEWVNEIKDLCTPVKVVWWNGTKAEYDSLLEEMAFLGKAIRLNQQKRPGCYLFRSDPSDVARVENRTFISTMLERDAGPTNNWVSPLVLKPKMLKLFDGSMKGRTMYVIPFSMGPIGSKFSKIGVEISDSPYVTVNMHIMTRTGINVLEVLGEDGEFVKCLHSVGYPLNKGQVDLPWPSAPIENKYISHFPEDNMIWAYGSGYGGNALLGKKCFALRIASHQARNEGWLAEHMLILKLTSPQNEIKYITGAFPSACGKTNLAMILPSIPGWKAETLGDDIAWLRFQEDGYLHAINPEAGFFGVAHGTSYKTNPNAMKTILTDTIFTNVALTDDGDIWWEGMTKEIPSHLIDWEGNDWYRGSGKKAAHANSRFTAPIKNCPVVASNWEDPLGVPISAILFGGRRPSTIPLIHESFDFNHGVFLGSIMGSEITAATISDNIGKVRRDPFAMLPFIGYNISDYVNHWLDMGKKSTKEKLPKIFYINWFRKNKQGEYLWPGFGDNIRVLKWVFERTNNKDNVIISRIGYLPKLNDLDLEGLDISQDKLDELFSIKESEWIDEIKSIEDFYKLYGNDLPKELRLQLDALEERMSISKKNTA
ncbi:MAG: phosphoenolpyruvate carboxykinase (GTP) [Firmicutes bacterium]|nr:phosphoenolpyruvate carboxykinase (GTP) [Bacillota bacterium]